MSNLTALARDWLEYKQAEAAATKARHAIEAQMAQALEVKSEGAITHQIEGYKITLTQPVARKLDARAWEMVKGDCPDALHPVKIKLEPDVSGVKWLVENEPDIWRKIATAFETKPGKVGVKVEEVKDGD